jgi:hypothetical protein
MKYQIDVSGTTDPDIDALNSLISEPLRGSHDAIIPRLQRRQDEDSLLIGAGGSRSSSGLVFQMKSHFWNHSMRLIAGGPTDFTIGLRMRPHSEKQRDETEAENQQVPVKTRREKRAHG